VSDLLDDEQEVALETQNFLQTPSVPAEASEELRREMANRGRQDLYFLTKVILGYTKLTPHTHAALCRFLQGAKFPRRMLLMPRSHYKTTIATIAHTIYLILNDPEIRILIIADTGTNAQRFMREIRNHFESNELFRWLYSELVPEDFSKTIWNNEEIVVRRASHWREPTVDAIGAMGGVESRHYDYIKADDLITEKAIRSDADLENRIEWFKGIESLLVSPKDTIDVVGSRKRQADLYEFVEKFFGGRNTPARAIGPHAVAKGQIAIFSRQAIEEGKPIFPEEVPLSFLVRLRTEAPERYNAQYANNPRATGLTTFRDEWKRFPRFLPDGKIELRHNNELLETINPWAIDRYVLYDPAVAETKKSCRNAILVVGKGEGPHRVILEGHIGHYTPDAAVDLIFDIEKRWKPSFFLIEKRGFQGALKYWIEDRALREFLPIPSILEYPIRGQSNTEIAKGERIKGLQPFFRAGFIWVPEDLVEFWDEYDFYPRSQFVDGLDALSFGLDVWPDSTDEATTISRAANEKEYLMRAGISFSGLMEDGKKEEWNEQKFLQGLGVTGYGNAQTFNH
jgi:hypothetical protein